MVEFNKGWNKRLYINVGITNNINGYIGGGINPPSIGDYKEEKEWKE